MGNGITLAQDKRTLLRVGATPSGTGWYFYTAQVATVLSQNLPNVEISVRETGGTRENVLRMGRKELDMGFSEALVSYEAYRGIGRFKDRAISDKRLLWNITTSHMHWAVAQDSGIKTFEDLADKSFNPSTIGGGGEYITEMVFALLGFKPRFHRARLADAAEAFRDGRIVGFSYNGTIPTPIFVETHASRPLLLLSLREDQVKKVTETYPFLIRRVIPANTYRGVPEAVTVGLYFNVSINREISDETVYQIVKTYWKHLPDIAKAFPLVANSRPDETIRHATVPLHQGALRFYREIGLKIPKELIPPEAQ
jgi:TRAP transporter TAXI family solute receptor